MRFLIFMIFSVLTLFASLNDKSAILYYGKNISYPMVGVHDYIIVQPDSINSYRHGFRLYQDKIYAYVSIGEIHSDTKEYGEIDLKWIVAENRAWNSQVIDIKNEAYQQFLFEKMIKPLIKRGFRNFFFDTLDAYQLAAKSDHEREESEKALAQFINTFHQKYPESKLIINRGFEIIDDVHNAVDAVLFESYYQNANYEKVSDADRVWLDRYIQKIKSYDLDVISVEYVKEGESQQARDIVENVLAKEMIPYVANRHLNSYGLSSKNAIKREVLTLIDESTYDRALLGAHQYGALPLEYMGYIQKLHDINKGIPPIDEVRHYAGLVVWLRSYYKDSEKLIEWLVRVKELGVKVLFVNNFGVSYSSEALKKLGIEIDNSIKKHTKVLIKDEMIGFESQPALSLSYLQIKSKHSKALLVYENSDQTTSTPAAITSWGGYAVESAYMNSINGNDMWVIDPFKFYREALKLPYLPVPDTTTENGKRLFFSHIDGDGIMSEVEGEKDMLSGESVFQNILSKYKVPQSVSIVGGEIQKEGLYPQLFERLEKNVKEMYSLENVEAATHTFSHPFKWGKIQNGALDKAYRLDIKEYNFSLKREISGSLENINSDFLPEGKKKSKTIFWTGDCVPKEDALEYTYKHNILNINGGDTTIMNVQPWLGKIAPLALQRGPYYQVYTGAQNENVYTNNWSGPFWGYKRAIQTFKLTDSPRRLKPIDIYYHFYSGSKIASIHAVQDVFSWALQQDIMPIYTSEYIPKVMDYFEVSIAQEESSYLVEGMQHLKTLRLEGRSVDLRKSPSVMGETDFETHTYVALDGHRKHLITLGRRGDDINYLISANAAVKYHKFDGKTRKLYFNGYVPLQVELFLPQKCQLGIKPQESSREVEGSTVRLNFREDTRAIVSIKCN